MAMLRLGTSSWTAKGWEEAFYPAGARSADYIREYAKRFSTVEIDSSFYGTPKRDTVKRWRDQTPDGFVFAAKAPQTITHERFLEDCEEELETYLATMQLLGDRLGPLLFQFPYFAKARGVDLQQFIDRLAPFLELLPRDGFHFAVEIRNKTWLRPVLFDVLRARGIALALIDHPWMPRPAEWFRKESPVTAEFVYVRWLGDRKAIEEVTTVWKENVIDRKRDLESWVPPIQSVLESGVSVFGYVNNHYSGYAPSDVEFLAGRLGQ